MQGISIKTVFKKLKDHPLYEEGKQVLLFIVLTLALHFLYRFWANILFYWPIPHLMHSLGNLIVINQYRTTFWSLDNIFNIPYVVKDTVIWFSNHHGYYINENCSGLKQIAQFIVLMLFFRGPWKHRLWYIPLGVFAIYMTGVVRVVLLAVSVNIIPNHYHFVHSYVLRTFFYIVIFVFWLVWVRVFTLRRSKADTEAQP